MAIPATQLRPGMVIKHNNDLHSVFSVEHRTPGQSAGIHPGQVAQPPYRSNVRAPLPLRRSPSKRSSSMKCRWSFSMPTAMTTTS